MCGGPADPDPHDIGTISTSATRRPRRREPLPTIMAEGAVRFGHAVRVFALLHGVAAVLRRIHELARQAAGHGLFRPGTGSRNEPTDGERLCTLRTNLDRNLVGCAADAAGTDLDARL